MKKIGITSSGTIIVEMTAAQYGALAQFQTPQIEAVPSARPEVAKMTTAERVAYVRERIIKLKPRKKDGVVRSISAMFQFSGGIEALEIQRVIASLQKEKFLAIDANGRVKYKEA